MSRSVFGQEQRSIRMSIPSRSSKDVDDRTSCERADPQLSASSSGEISATRSDPIRPLLVNVLVDEIPNRDNPLPGIDSFWYARRELGGNAARLTPDRSVHGAGRAALLLKLANHGVYDVAQLHIVDRSPALQHCR